MIVDFRIKKCRFETEKYLSISKKSFGVVIPTMTSYKNSITEKTLDELSVSSFVSHMYKTRIN